VAGIKLQQGQRKAAPDLRYFKLCHLPVGREKGLVARGGAAVISIKNQPIAIIPYDQHIYKESRTVHQQDQILLPYRESI
jgi:hypothetical protein